MIRIKPPTRARAGFTFIEIMMVVMIMATMAMFAVPMIRSSNAGALDAAARLLRSDLERAQVTAMACPDRRIGLRFDQDGGGWQLVDADAPGVALRDEYSGQPISIRLGQGRGQVAADVRLDPTGLAGEMLVFDPLGGLENPGPPARLRLRSDENTAAVRISAATGWITID
ncbi:MAG: prepilin-type N-terminal cleavage/methylation domain-containing protein [Phycisphaerales bacterium]|nr:prepilin-type N-terminal cleavage/methylation domain-containing protein [Phycisphaerales bacterium]